MGAAGGRGHGSRVDLARRDGGGSCAAMEEASGEAELAGRDRRGGRSLRLGLEQPRRASAKKALSGSRAEKTGTSADAVKGGKDEGILVTDHF